MTEPTPVIKPAYFFQPVLNQTYKRIVDSGQELVHYLKDSSLRIWLNTEAVSYDTHWHDALEVIMPVKEGYDVEIEGQHFSLKEGDMCIIPSQVQHRLTAPASGSRMVYLFEWRVVRSLPSFPLVEKLLQMPIIITKAELPAFHMNAQERFYKMANAYFEGGSYRDMLVYSQLLPFLALLAEQDFCDDGRPARLGPLCQVQKERFSNILSWLDENYADNLTLEKVAAQANYSKYHFERLFKEYSAHTFHEYLTKRRLEAAIVLLAEGKRSIGDIALETGFKSLSTFNRAFKRQKHCTPREFARRIEPNRENVHPIGNTSHTGFDDTRILCL